MRVTTTLAAPNLDKAYRGNARSFDAACSSFTLSAWAAWPESMKSLQGRINLESNVLHNWNILSSDKEYSLLNDLTAPSVAHDCLRWIENGNVELRFSPALSMPLILFSQEDGTTSGTMNFPMNAEGCGNLPPSKAFATPIAMEGSQAQVFQSPFNNFWHAAEQKQVEVFKQQLRFLATPPPASLLYYRTCQKLVGNASEEDSSLCAEYGFFESVTWRKLFPFQKDGVRSVIAKLEKFNGCILADSVGLGKTYEALVVIKYHKFLNEKVLVLCPKRLNGNWSLFNQSHNKRSEIRPSCNICLQTSTAYRQPASRSSTVSGNALSTRRTCSCGWQTSVAVAKNCAFREATTRKSPRNRRSYC